MSAKLCFDYSLLSYFHMDCVSVLLLSICTLSLQDFFKNTQMLKGLSSHQIILTAIQIAQFSITSYVVGLTMLLDSLLPISL